MNENRAVPAAGRVPREARESFLLLLREVSKGREIVITDRGQPVARLVPLAKTATRPFPDLAAFRKRLPRLAPPLSGSLTEERTDRL